MLANTDARLTGEAEKDEIVRLNDRIVRQQREQCILDECNIMPNFINKYGTFFIVTEHPGFMRAYLSTIQNFPFTSLHSRFEAAGAGRDVLVIWV